MMHLYDELLSNAKTIMNKLNDLGYPHLNIEFSIKRLTGRIAGMATMSMIKRTVDISIDYLREHKEFTITNTLAHEICHHYIHCYFPTAKQHHGPEFRALMKQLGYDGSTYHSMMLSTNNINSSAKTKTRYVYVSMNTNTEVHLTKTQHNNSSNFFYKGEKLLYTGKTFQFK